MRRRRIRSIPANKSPGGPTMADDWKLSPAERAFMDKLISRRGPFRDIDPSWGRKAHDELVRAMKGGGKSTPIPAGPKKARAVPMKTPKTRKQPRNNRFYM